MKHDDKRIPGFTRHGDKWRGQVIVDEATAEDVAAEAAARHTTTAQALRERIVASLWQARRGGTT